MKRKPSALLLMVLAAPILSILLGSCLTNSSRHNRGSLSDAMEKARDDHDDDDRRVPDHQREPEEDIPDNWFDDDDGQDDNPPYNNEDQGDYASADDSGGSSIPAWFSIRGGLDVAATNSMVNWVDGDLLFGAAGDRFEFYITGGIKASHPEEGSSLDESVKDPLIFLKGGLETRLKLLGPRKIFSPYLCLAFGGFIMFWEFENALESGSDTITGDSLTGFFFSGGLGVYPVQTKDFRFGFCAMPEFYLYDDVTAEGFDNDFFDPFFTLKIVAEISFNTDG